MKVGKQRDALNYTLIVSYSETNANPDSIMAGSKALDDHEGASKRFRLDENRKILGLYVFEPTKTK
ncbi:MAG TPA: hypothetical protein VKX40_05895 [Aequorivita sp.]|nr:hypothetical protein [Aequorivita sp.]